jgi:hypothetical protein
MLFGQSFFACTPLASPSPVPTRDLSWRDNCPDTSSWSAQAAASDVWSDQAVPTDTWDLQSTDEPTSRSCGYVVTPCSGGG